MKATKKTTAVYRYVLIEDEGGLDVIRVRIR